MTSSVCPCLQPQASFKPLSSLFVLVEIKMNMVPSISDIARRRAYFSKDPKDLMLDVPRRPVQECLDYYSEKMLLALFQFNAASTARICAEWAWAKLNAEYEGHLEDLPVDALAELAIEAQRRRAKEEAAEERFLAIRGRFFDEISYALHFNEVMMRLAKDLAGDAAPALRTLPERLTWRDWLRIAAALGRKARVIKEAGRAASRRRLLRGLPLVEV
jgi:hypothetical protein